MLTDSTSHSTACHRVGYVFPSAQLHGRIPHAHPCLGRTRPLCPCLGLHQQRLRPVPSRNDDLQQTVPRLVARALCHHHHLGRLPHPRIRRRPPDEVVRHHLAMGVSALDALMGHHRVVVRLPNRVFRDQEIHQVFVCQLLDPLLTCVFVLQQRLPSQHPCPYHGYHRALVLSEILRKPGSPTF